jgi:hypothetical protein
MFPPSPRVRYKNGSFMQKKKKKEREREKNGKLSGRFRLWSRLAESHAAAAVALK